MEDDTKLTWSDTAVRVSDGALLSGLWRMPPGAKSVVLLASVSRQGLHSPANQFLVEAFAKAGYACLLIDLLTSREHDEDAEVADMRYDIGLLSARLVDVVDWIKRELPGARIGILAAATAAAAALSAAVERKDDVAAVVSRGGRPDLAGDALRSTAIPTLLLVGGEDSPLVDLNREAAAWLRGEYRVEIISGATGLSGNNPSDIEALAIAVGDWFEMYLPVDH